MTRALLVPADNEDLTRFVDLPEGETNPCRAVSEYLGDCVEMVKVDPLRKIFMFVDENGNLTGLPYNRRASMLYGHPRIVGDVVLVQLRLEYTDEGPDHILESLDDSNYQRIQRAFKVGMARFN